MSKVSSTYMPSNFHEDATRHYLLKLDIATQRGELPKVKPNRPASNKTMLDLLANGNLTPRQRANLKSRVHGTPPVDHVDIIMSKLSVEKRAQLKKLLGT